MGKMTRPNCIYGDESIDDAEDTFFFIVREGGWNKRNLKAKVGACTYFCEVILSSEENWNRMAGYTEPLLNFKKFDLDERSRMDVQTPSRILLPNPDAHMDMKELKKMLKHFPVWSNSTVIPEWAKWVQKGRGIFSRWRPYTRSIVTTSPMVRLGRFNPPQWQKKSLYWQRN